MGVAIFIVVTLLLYIHITSVTGSVLRIINQSLLNPAPANQTTTGELIFRTIRAEIQKANSDVVLWVTVTLILFAYALASITLLPIRRAMEKQKRFIANVSHELRTPLAVMKTTSEVALDGLDAMSREELVDILKSNLEEVNRMSRITKFFLDFAGLENGPSSLTLTRVDLVQITKSAADLMSKIASKKQIVFTFVHATPTSVIWGNAIALEEMILNLLKNAVHYTPFGGSILVSISKRTYGAVVLSIEDTGVGIAPQDLANIFEPFHRGKNAVTKRGESNVGLGLAIVREIVRFHHASISAKSEVGEGTTVAVRFSSFFSGS
jgi:signal transduction histidine kinase